MFGEHIYHCGSGFPRLESEKASLKVGLEPLAGPGGKITFGGFLQSGSSRQMTCCPALAWPGPRRENPGGLQLCRGAHSQSLESLDSGEAHAGDLRCLCVGGPSMRLPHGVP